MYYFVASGMIYYDSGIFNFLLSLCFYIVSHEFVVCICLKKLFQKGEAFCEV